MRRIISVVTLCTLVSSCVNRTETTAVVTDSTAVSQQSQPSDTATQPQSTDTNAAYTQQSATNVAYRLITQKDSIKAIRKSYSSALPTLLAANRADSANISKLDTLLVPTDVNADVEQLSPFPMSLPFLSSVEKIVYFSYPAQYFAAYERGRRVYTGPTNMGRRKDPTPTGLFFTNWKAEKTRSTFNDEWELKWNFNIENKQGIGWHQYAMPGYPASHSCLRLTEADAKKLYEFADEWLMKGGKTLAQGTPVIVYGSYPFGQQKPWYQLAQDPHALDISVEQLQQETQPHMAKITSEQQRKGGQGKSN